MTILPTTIKDEKGAVRKVSRAEIAYACSRFQHQIHNLLTKVVKESGISQKELAGITGIDEATVCRVLSGPRNMESNTLSKLIFGASGATLTVALAYPQTAVRRPIVLASMISTPLDEKKTGTRRFIVESLDHRTSVGKPKAATNTDVLDWGVAASYSGRVREMIDA